MSSQVPSTLSGMTTTQRRARNINRPRLDHELLGSGLRQWLDFRRQEKRAKTEAEKLKENFKAIVERFGMKDDKGSLFVELPQPVDKVVALKNQRNVTPTVNDEEAEKILRSKGLWTEPYIQMRPVIDYDAVRGAVFERKISKAESNRIFGSSESFSFIALDANGKAVTG